MNKPIKVWCLVEKKSGKVVWWSTERPRVRRLGKVYSVTHAKGLRLMLEFLPAKLYKLCRGTATLTLDKQKKK